MHADTPRLVFNICRNYGGFSHAHVRLSTAVGFTLEPFGYKCEIALLNLFWGIRPPKESTHMIYDQQPCDIKFYVRIPTD